jgi:hypothetical protein
MAHLLIELVGENGDAEAARLREYLTSMTVPMVPTEHGLTTTVSSVDDCSTLAEHLVAFIKNTTSEFDLRVDGPAGDAVIYQLRTSQDTKSISGYLSTCAYFQ